MNHKFTEVHADGGLVRNCQSSRDMNEIKQDAQCYGKDRHLLSMFPDMEVRSSAIHSRRGKGHIWE